MNTIAVVDPASYALPYDYFYIKSLAKNYRVDFYCSRTRFNEDYLIEIDKLDNVRVKKYTVSDCNRIVGVFNLLRMYCAIILSAMTYSSINVQWTVFKFTDIFFYILINGKLIFTFHNVKPHKLSSKDRSTLDYLIYKLAKKIIFVSEYTQSEFLKVHNLDKNKTFLLRHGVMPITQKITRKKLDSFDGNISSSALKIIFWGNVKDYKGLDFLVNSLEHLIKNNIELEVYGKFDRDQKYLYEKLISNGIKSIDDYLSLDYVASILTQPNVLSVLPYKNASQSGIMYNLLAHNIPFVASRSGETYRFLSENNLGKLSFEYGDIESLLQAILYYRMNKDEVMENMSKISKEYNWQYENKLLKDIFG